MKTSINRTLLTTLLFLALFIAATFTVNAHHGWSGYPVEFTMTATVVDLRFANPHDQIWVEDAQGKRWNFLLAPPTRNRRFGYDETVVAVGDTVEIFGQHSKTKAEGKAHTIKNAADELIYTYYYDSGQTSLERRR